MNVRVDLDQFLLSIPENVTLVAATKYVGSDEILKLVNHRIFNIGENRVDSFLLKYSQLQNNGIIWHFIGHLQRNKAKLVANKIDFLHSLDSVELAIKLNELRSVPLKCFIEVSINNEENKNGISLENLDHFIEEIKPLKNIQIVGLMMMTLKGSSEEQQYKQFNKLKLLLDEINKKHNLSLKELSMGMSDDYKKAIDAGSTYIRLGRILFSE